MPSPSPTSGPLPRTAVVLGGGSDIAAATVSQLCDQGLESVVLAGRRPERFVAPDRPALAVHRLAWDALDPDGHRGLVDQTVAHLGAPPDLVLCAVGSLGHHAGLTVDPVEVDRSLRTNVVGPAAAVLAWAQVLAERGSGTIVVLSSVAGVRTRRSNFVYGAGKAGLDAFSLGLADAVADRGVRVLVVRPGFVRSQMTAGLDPAPLATDPDTVARAIVARLARGRGGVVWVPGVFRYLFAGFGLLPTPLWRRVAGNR